VWSLVGAAIKQDSVSTRPFRRANVEYVIAMSPAVQDELLAVFKRAEFERSMSLAGRDQLSPRIPWCASV
jgi:hypothetical protein